ncbi:hypothetical protein [Demequina salsinemoris]|uniref:hypothetical protein n=1 Tax=Demequina salsinemoris TaxID=577470 RepID=UPI0007835C54|nr:hypothetical protein [Demequina salsinemoris]
MTSFATPRLIIQPRTTRLDLGVTVPTRPDPRTAFQRLWEYAYSRHQEEAALQNPRRSHATPTQLP